VFHLTSCSDAMEDEDRSDTTCPLHRPLCRCPLLRPQLNNAFLARQEEEEDARCDNKLLREDAERSAEKKKKPRVVALVHFVSVSLPHTCFIC